MIVIIKLVFFSILTNVNSLVGRCYLCSEDTLAECIGSTQTNSPIYKNVLQYYTEPCNGQCVLFRDENHWIVRGCSWTYGHMTSKSTGWHDIIPGIKAYFCNSHLCNSGTYEQMEKLMMNTEGHNHWRLQRRQLRQCYVCTARFQGCGEFLNPHYASRYIRSCPTSCIIFRNPRDLNLITRDCSLYWPQVHAKTGLHKFYGTNAYFCQDSLCNGISFDFIMGIFHNRLSPVITLPPTRITETTSTTNAVVTIETTTTLPILDTSTLNISNETETTLSTIEHLSTTTTTPIINFIPLISYHSIKNQTISTIKTPQSSYDYCKNKQCYYGGRLNSDCLCICLPTFTGDNCETALCDDEPGDICAFMLEHECQINDNRYLCPNFCQLDICLPNQT